MPFDPTRTALITGANVGLGFEAARQLLQDSRTRVLLVCRTPEKAQKARQHLRDATGNDNVEAYAADMTSPAQLHEVADAVSRDGHRIDLLLLNAGMLGREKVVRTAEGFEESGAASLVGHHILTTALLHSGSVTADARIVIATSDAAKGEMPGMEPTAVRLFAQQHLGGDLEAAVQTLLRAQTPYRYRAKPHYATVKVFVSWWASALARRVSSTTKVFAVAPGAAFATSAMRHQSLAFRALMFCVLQPLMMLFGMATTVGAAAAKYLDVAYRYDTSSGGTYGAQGVRMRRAPTRLMQPHLLDEELQEMLWTVLARTTGSSLPHDPAAAPRVDGVSTGSNAAAEDARAQQLVRRSV
ncbi:MAG: SDR family NAD(P)-dependent oxidoreductase [Nannocystales bacterium]